MPGYRRPFITDLFQRHRRDLWARLSRRVDPAEAEDVVQDAYLHLLQRAEVTDIQDARTFLYTTAYHLAVDLNRARQARARRLAHAGTVLDPQSAPQPEAFVEGPRELARLREALAELEPRCRDALLLHRLDGVTHEAIAARFAVSVRTIERDIAKALTHLHARLAR